MENYFAHYMSLGGIPEVDSAACYPHLGIHAQRDFMSNLHVG